MDNKYNETQHLPSSAGPSQARFNMDYMDQSAPNKQNPIKESKAAISGENELGDMSLLLQQVELTKSKYKNDQIMGIGCETRLFSVFGPSVYLYFEFVRKLIFLFIWLTILSLIPVVYNLSAGATYDQDSYGITSALAKTTIGSHLSTQPRQHEAKIINVVVWVFNLFFLMIFWLFWKNFTLEESNRIQKQLKLSNYGAIVVEKKENIFDENQLATFLGQFGKVEEIIKVVDIKSVLIYGKQIVELKRQNSIYECMQQIDETRRRGILNKITLNQTRIKQLEDQLIKQLKSLKCSQEKVLRYFVKFDSHEAVQRILKTLAEYQGCCANQIPEELLLNDQLISVARQECQPYEIYWQNQSVTWRQTLLPQILMLVFVNLFVIGALIMIALLLASARPVYYFPSLQSNSFNQTAITNQTQNLIDSWCLAGQPQPQNKNLCNQVYNLYHIRIGIHVVIAFLLMITKIVVKHIILFFRPYLRFKDKVQESKEILMHLLINYSMISILVTLCLQTKLFSSAMVNTFIDCVQDPIIKKNLMSLLQYNDYTSQWYLDYGFQLMLNFFVMTVLPHCLTPVAEMVINKIKQLNASKQKLLVLMKKQLQLRTFQLQDHYATTFSILLAGLFFAGSMPLMFLLILLAQIAKFYSTKYLFLNMNQPPLITDRTLANKIPPIFLFIITGYLLNSIWAFGVQYIFAPQSNLFEDRGINADSNASNPFEALQVFLKRLASTWQPAIVYIVGIIAILLRKLLWKVLLSFSSSHDHQKQGTMQAHGQHVQTQQQQLREDVFPKISYKKQENPQYSEVLDYISSLRY